MNKKLISEGQILTFTLPIREGVIVPRRHQADGRKRSGLFLRQDNDHQPTRQEHGLSLTSSRPDERSSTT